MKRIKKILRHSKQEQKTESKEKKLTIKHFRGTQAFFKVALDTYKEKATMQELKASGDRVIRYSNIIDYIYTHRSGDGNGYCLMLADQVMPLVENVIPEDVDDYLSAIYILLGGTPSFDNYKKARDLFGDAVINFVLSISRDIEYCDVVMAQVVIMYLAIEHYHELVINHITPTEHPVDTIRNLICSGTLSPQQKSLLRMVESDLRRQQQELPVLDQEIARINEEIARANPSSLSSLSSPCRSSSMMPSSLSETAPVQYSTSQVVSSSSSSAPLSSSATSERFDRIGSPPVRESGIIRLFNIEEEPAGPNVEETGTIEQTPRITS